MNEQFKKLMEQAIQECKPDDIPTKEKTLQRYGELIIKECLDIMTKEEYNKTMLASNPITSGAIWDAKYNIKKHFGIK